MRSKLFLAGITFAIGCGGGGGKKAMIVDAMVDSPTIDSAATCSVMPTLNMLNLQCPNMGPVTGDWIDTDRMGGLTGKTVLSVGGRLPGSGTTSMIDVLIVDVVKPDNGAFPTNTAVNFDPNPATTAPVAMSYIFGDADMAGNITNFYFASNGSVTLMSAGANDGASIVGNVAATNYREIDDMNADVPGGCTTSLGGLAFKLTQMDNFMGNGCAAFDNNNSNEGITLQPLTPEEWAHYRKLRDQRLAR